MRLTVHADIHSRTRILGLDGQVPARPRGPNMGREVNE